MLLVKACITCIVTLVEAYVAMLMTVLFSVASTDVDVISTKLTEKYCVISEFMCSNKLKLNDDKTNLLLLGTESAWRSRLTEDSLTLNTGSSVTV